MKKLVLLGAVAIVALSSCKKEYECCFYENGTKIEASSNICTTQKLSKKDADAANYSIGTTEFKCVKN